MWIDFYGAMSLGAMLGFVSKSCNEIPHSFVQKYKKLLNLSFSFHLLKLYNLFVSL